MSYGTWFTGGMDRETDRWVRSEEARAKLRNLLDDIARGAHVYVLRYDKPAAVLVPVEWYERVRAACDEAPGAT
jgi:PHD/YefM family antitoxin component YafN of YafNO toxin-antitoxin module